MQTWTSLKTSASQSFFNVTQHARLDAVMLQPLLRGLRVSIYLSGGSRPRSLILSLRGPGPFAPCLRSFASQTQTEKATPSSPPPVQLRNYQLECIQSVVNAFKDGHKRVGISLATGGGKTVSLHPHRTVLYIATDLDARSSLHNSFNMLNRLRKVQLRP